ncbi:MAG: cardiolipin synthase ClsB, partial [Burkholderiales bacterium]|nr:cardiolipin synthase ClsB [Burkholderiales bacterium]
MTPKFVDGNKLRLLRNGTDYFPALQQAIDVAKGEIYLETYIFRDDGTGQAIAGALARAAQRGVAVRVLVDGFGCKDHFAEIRERLLAANVQVLIYRPKISPLTLRRNRLRRMHRKLAVIDARVAFAGGINIIDDMDTPGDNPPRYDYAVRIEGPLLAPIVEEVERLWSRVAWASLRRRWRDKRIVAVDAAPRGSQRAALVVRDNLRHRSDIEDAYLAAIGNARVEIIIANAYFFPGVRFRRALLDATRRGVRVMLLLQGRVEYFLQHYASRAFYGPLLDAGVEIYEYKRSFMHAKVAVIDRRWSTVGSSNIDPFSLLLAREANIVVDDQPFAQELRSNLQRDMESG